MSPSLCTIFWGECVKTAVYLINRPPSILHEKSLIEIISSRTLDVSYLRVFGCLCVCPCLYQGQISISSRRYMFIGYPNNKERWNLYDLETNQYFVFYDVQFFADKFPFSQQNPNPSAILDPATQLNSISPSSPLIFDHFLQSITIAHPSLGSNLYGPLSTSSQIAQFLAQPQHPLGL